MTGKVLRAVPAPKSGDAARTALKSGNGVEPYPYYRNCSERYISKVSETVL